MVVMRDTYDPKDTASMVRKIQLLWSERYSFYAVGSTFLYIEMPIVSPLPVLPKAPTAPLFFCLADQILVLWLTKQILLLAVDIESNPGPTLVCAAKLHAGAGASVHVLNHTTTPTQYSSATQARNTKLATHNPIKTPRATGIFILQVNINGITNKQLA